ncbi:hypothetical protein ACWD5R_27300 [Streptomyces sp. NPDC002514]|uniref:hypothetical protein n=1 Tax=Streptomyces sp. NPDC001270 TaxID=3364554 RepID=UPI0036847638
MSPSPSDPSDVDYFGDTSSYETSRYYTQHQRGALAYLNQLFRDNEQRGWRQHFRDHPMNEEMEAARDYALATLQDFIETGRTVQDARTAYHRDQNSRLRWGTYESAKNLHREAADVWIAYGTTFYEYVRTALDYRDANTAQLTTRRIPSGLPAQLLAEQNPYNQRRGTRTPPPQQNNGYNGYSPGGAGQQSRPRGR